MNEFDRTEEQREAARRAREAERARRGEGAPPPLVLDGQSAEPVPAAGPDLYEDFHLEESAAPLAPRQGKGTGRSARNGSARSAGARRSSRSSPERTGTRTGASRRDRPRSDTRTRTRAPRASGGIRRLQLAIVGVLGVIVAALIWFLLTLFQPFAGSGTGKVAVTIPASASTSQIGTLLVKRGVVSSSFFFRLRAELAGDHFRAGTYNLAHGMSYSAALHALTTLSGLPPSTNVTIIPGKSRYQLSQLLHSQGVRGSYLRETVSSPLLDPRRYGAPANTPSLEGFLYPDTYQLREPLSIPALVADQLAEFKTQVAKVNFSYARSKNLTVYDVLKVASLEMAEAALPSDLPKVASVIYNRLHLGMTLGLDTTAAYAANNYSGNLTQSQLNSSSPWNTLNHQGLPPTPINSPDLSAIEAAAHPAHTDYLYFIVKVCGNGSLNFTNDYNQFLIWSRQYSDALNSRGAQKTEFCHSHG